jgi:hypothetical protein
MTFQGTIGPDGRVLVDVGDSGASLASGAVAVDSTAGTQIRPANPSRIALAIVNAGPDDAFIGAASNVTDAAGGHPGYYLAVGASLALTSTAALYARCSTANTATVTWLEESP